MKKILLSILFILGGITLTIAQVKQLPFDNYIKKREGLPNTRYAIQKQKQVTIAFLGGSITFNPGWRDSVCAYFKQTFPQVKFRFIAAGIPSLGSLPHVFRLQRDVLDSGRIDLLFLEAAVNDQVNGTDSLTQVRDLEGIIRHARKSNPAMDVIMMSFADPDKTKLFQQGLVPTSVANHELVAGYYQLPSINLAKAVSDKLANHEFDWNKDFKDLHPSPFGQALYFAAIKQLLASELNGKAFPAKKKIFKMRPLLNKASFTNGSYISIENAKIDANWTLDPSWTPADKKGTRPGFVQVPMLISTTPGSSLTLNFKGTAVGVAIVSGPDAGIMTYRIDNGTEQQKDLYTAWSPSLHLPWYILFSGDLKNGDHVLKLSISDEKNPGSVGTACRIVYFLVNR